MIVEFSVANFRSIKEMQTISFAASKLDSSKDNALVDINNVVEEGGMRLLKTVGIYGPNASGKSNIIRALEHFVEFVGMSAGPHNRLEHLSDPFLYQDYPSEGDSFFQIIFILETKKYRYGFTVKNNIISSEWLYGTLNKNMVPFFIRNESSGIIDVKDVFKEAREVPSLEIKHNLFLVHVASFKKSIATSIFDYFVGKIIYSYLGAGAVRGMTIGLIRGGEWNKVAMRKFLSEFNISYDDITIDTDQIFTSINPIDHNKISLKKTFKNRDGVLKEVKLNLGLNESAGTQKIFDLAGAILASLLVGYCFIIDELDSNFHPSLLIKLINMFNDPKINTAKGQLLFTTHDTNLLNPAIMRRDQFYFTEKNEEDATRLYSLADLKGIRNDADFARQYLAGFYGALPVLSNYTEKVAQDE